MHYPRPHTLAGVPDSAGNRPVISRRHLIGLAAGVGATALLSGCTDGPGPDRQSAACVARGQLARRTSLAGLPLVYEVNRRRNAFWFDAGFAGQLDAWVADVQGGGLRAIELWTYGAWTDGREECRSWHNSGRAFDLARIRLRTGFVSCRYDEWRTATGPNLRRALGEYWALAASLHRHFAYVVTYLYDTEHHNHIHVDNGRSDGQRSVFDPGSITQVQAVQAIATHVWNRPVEITGRFDAATREATQAVLGELGHERSLTESGGWDRFLSASAGTLARS